LHFEAAVGRFHAFLRVSGVFGPVLLMGCAARMAPERPAASAADPCETTIIASFFREQGSRPDERFVTDLAHAAAVHLTFLRSIGPHLYVFSVTAPDADPGCREALERLRHDPRVRSVDVDTRRRAHGFSQ